MELFGMILLYYVFILAAVALTYYIGSVCWHFLREQRQAQQRRKRE